MMTNNSEIQEHNTNRADHSTAAAVRRSQLIFVWVALVVLILDQLSKWRVEATIPLNVSVTPLPALDPYFRLSHVANTGAAFGFFEGGSLIFTILASVVAVVILWYNFTLQTQSKLARIALGLLFGGAVGNLLDRLRQGYVTDFLDFDVSSIIDVPLANWAVFNVADMAVVAGVILLAIVMIRNPESLENAQESQNE